MGLLGSTPIPNQQVHSLDAVGQVHLFQPTRSSKRTERYFHAQHRPVARFGFRQGTKKGPLPSRMRQHRRLRCDLTWPVELQIPPNIPKTSISTGFSIRQIPFLGTSILGIPRFSCWIYSLQLSSARWASEPPGAPWHRPG